MTVSRGWSVLAFEGHILRPASPTFRPRRDVDQFMDREGERHGCGVCDGVDKLSQLLKKDAVLHADPDRHWHTISILTKFRNDLCNTLGESRFVHGLAGLIPSRFSNTTVNGLWEYSPYLCGTGLMEALELAYALGQCVMDRLPAPFCMTHLHNMLVRKGLIQRRVGLFVALEELFSEALFVGGKIPTSRFAEAYDARLRLAEARDLTAQRWSSLRNSQRANDIHGALQLSINRCFREKSVLRLYREANWNLDRIPDDSVPPALLCLRIGQAKRSIDPVTDKRSVNDTALFKRARRQGIDEEDLVEVKLPGSAPDGTADEPVSERSSMLNKSLHRILGAGGIQRILNRSELLSVALFDTRNDVCGTRALSSKSHASKDTCVMKRQCGG